MNKKNYTVPFDAVINNQTYIITVKDDNGKRQNKLVKTFFFEKENETEILFSSTSQAIDKQQINFLVKNTAIRKMSNGQKIQVLLSSIDGITNGVTGRKALIQKSNI
tara:strand:+ start:75 stop:395 length:321 start_codon:yes stop_codon:yes gene_type:complete